MTPPSSGGRSAAVCALLALLAVVAAACGVDVDTSPRPVLTEPSTTTTSAVPAGGRSPVVLYYVREGTLLPVIEDLTDRRLDSTIAALLQPPTGAPGVAGLGTSIPAGTQLLDTDTANGQLRINLSSAFDNVVGRSREQAIGQMVLTATQDSDIEEVVFEVDGEPITVSSPNRGDRPEVGACDFRSLLATVDDASDALLPFEAVTALEQHRAELDEECV